MSPLLFLTVMEAFSKLMDRAGKLNLVKGLSLGVGDSMVKVSHLFFLQMMPSFSVNRIYSLCCI